MRNCNLFNSNRRKPVPSSLRKVLHRAVVETLEGRRLLSFSAPVNYAVGVGPGAVVSADFNNDGRSDLATANYTGNNVSVLLSNPNGTFAAAQNFPAGTSPRSVAVGDFNGDTKRDLVVNNAAGLSVLLGNGDGTFQAAQNVTLPDQDDVAYGTGIHPQTGGVSVAVGDINSDGKLDLAATGESRFEVHYTGYYGGDYVTTVTETYVNVLLGNGSGGFASSSAYRHNPYAQQLGIADFNGDTKPDVLAAGSGAAVLLGNGNGTLQPAVFSGFGYTPGPAPVGDFNGDGKLDILLSDGGQGIQLLKGLGNGTFQNQTSVNAGGRVRSIVAGDLNADGKLDIVANTFATTYSGYGYYGGYDPVTTDTTKVLMGYGTGTFSQPVGSTATGSHAGYGSTNAAALGDFNGDARPDVASTEFFDSVVTVQLNANDFVLPPALIIGDATVTEGNASTVNAVFTVSLSMASAQTVNVQYVTGNGVATSGKDFDALSSSLTFTPGEQSKTITVVVKGDVIDEYDEDFYVTLSSATNAEIADTLGLGTIVDNDAAPNIIISDASTREGRRGNTPLNFTVSLSSASEKEVRVDFTTANGSAQTGDGDYAGNAGTLIFSPGQTSKTIAVMVNGDKRRETSETFFVNLGGASNGIITDSQGIGTILDDDVHGRRK